MWHFPKWFRRRYWSMSAVALALCAFDAPIQGGTLYGVYASASAGAQGCGAGWSYDTWDGGGGGQSTTPSNISISDCSNTFSGSVATGLTSGTAQVDATAQSGGGTVGGTSFSAADLASAALHGYANSNGFLAFMDARLWDTLTFQIAGATDSTVTNVPFVYSVDGTLTGFPPGCATDPDQNCQSHSAGLQFAAGQVPCFSGANVVPEGGCSHSGLADWAWSEGYFTGEFDNSGLVSPTFALRGFVAG